MKREREKQTNKQAKKGIWYIWWCLFLSLKIFVVCWAWDVVINKSDHHRHVSVEHWKSRVGVKKSTPLGKQGLFPVRYIPTDALSYHVTISWPLNLTSELSRNRSGSSAPLWHFPGKQDTTSSLISPHTCRYSVSTINGKTKKKNAQKNKRSWNCSQACWGEMSATSKPRLTHFFLSCFLKSIQPRAL